MHALIIEDEPYIALVIEDQLRGHGFASFEVATGETEAVLAAGRCPPDLITADVPLASGCGIAAVAEICRERPVPVVFITASVGEVRARRRDAVAIAKPFAATDLELALTEAGIDACTPAPAGPSDGLQDPDTDPIYRGGFTWLSECSGARVDIVLSRLGAKDDRPSRQT